MAETETCYECGSTLSIDEMIQYDDKWVCALCKPVFLQKLKEGVNVTSAMDYAGFWIRFAAQFLDQVILGVVNQVIGMVLLNNALRPDQQLGMFGMVIAVQLIIVASYESFFIGKYSATPGKMACNIKVVTPEGEPIGYGRAIGRHFAKYLSSMILAIGYIMAAFDDEKRALHDRVCNTRVIKK